MIHGRRALGPIAAVWLICHAATLTLVPALLWFGPAAASLAACTCTHGADAMCPMHHKTVANPTNATGCVIQSLTPNAPATLAGLFGVVGLVPVPAVAVALIPTASPVVFERPVAAQRPSPPDPPPPRA